MEVPKAGLLKDPSGGRLTHLHPREPKGGGILPSRSWHPPACPLPALLKPRRPGVGDSSRKASGPREQLAGWGRPQAQGWGLSEYRQRGPSGLERRKRPRQLWRQHRQQGGEGRGRRRSGEYKHPCSSGVLRLRLSGRKRTFHTLAWRDLQPGAVMVAASGRHPPWARSLK